MEIKSKSYLFLCNIEENLLQCINFDNLYAIGDIDQCIYQWRNANPQLMLDFPKQYPDCEIIKLEDNFRSTFQIIKGANSLIKNNKNRFEKKLIAHKEGVPIKYITSENSNYEAYEIAKIILKSKREFKDFAILARSNFQIQNIKRQFKALGIPFNNNSSYLNSSIAKNIFNFLEAAINKENDIVMKKAINFPNKILNSIQLSKVDLKCSQKNISLFEGLSTFKFKEQSKINNFINNIIKLSKYDNILEAFKYCISVLDIKKDVKPIYKELIFWCNSQSKLNGNITTQNFLKWFKTKDIQDNLNINTKNEVNIMTVHCAKGLEFSIVFVIGMNQKIFPNEKSSLESERNLFYVAITRSKEILYLSNYNYLIYKNNYRKKVFESRFLKELSD